MQYLILATTSTYLRCGHVTPWCTWAWLLPRVLSGVSCQNSWHLLFCSLLASVVRSSSSWHLLYCSLLASVVRTSSSWHLLLCYRKSSVVRTSCFWHFVIMLSFYCAFCVDLSNLPSGIHKLICIWFQITSFSNVFNTWSYTTMHLCNAVKRPRAHGACDINRKCEYNK